MESQSRPLQIFFFPFVGGGHQIPMIDIARVFASHGVNSTIITTPKHSLPFHNLIHRDQISGLSISIHALNLPDNADISDTDMSASPFTDTTFLRSPLEKVLIECRPDCVVHDMFHRWCGEVIDRVGIPRLGFTGNACFSRCVFENLGIHKPHEKVESDYEPFIVSGLPDEIELTRSQLPIFMRKNGGDKAKAKLFDEKVFGVVVNSFQELETAYVDYFRNLGNNPWLVGPVSLCNRNVEDKAERGQKASVDQKQILNWLDCQEKGSVLYVSFGSFARLSVKQLNEIAYGLEASNHPFIWVIGKTRGEENWELPSGFAERIGETKRGLIIKGWAPQLLILEHESIGAFMTHCGWNSTLEGVSAGLAMITWPLSAEQFINEKLISDVLKIGVKVGSMEWLGIDMRPEFTVGRDKVEAAVKRLMDGGDEAVEMRRRAKELGEKAKRAVEVGGSSYKNVEALIQAIESLRK